MNVSMEYHLNRSAGDWTGMSGTADHCPLTYRSIV